MTVLAALAACASPKLPPVVCAAPPQGTAAHDPRPADPNVIAELSIGNRIDPALLQQIAQTALLDHLKLEITRDGHFDAFEIYHHDSAPIATAVKQLLAAAFPGAHVINYETAWEADIGPVTEVEFKTAGGRLCELNATRNGALRYTWCVLDTREVPPQLLQVALREAPSGQLIEAQYRQDGQNTPQWVLVMRVGSQEHVLRLSGDGGVLGRALRLNADVIIER